MKKILNWVCGSFFRTFGRLLCFCIIGYFLFVILDKLNFEFPSFNKLLGIEKVNALGLDGWGEFNTGYDIPLNYHVYNCTGDDNCPTNVTLTQEGYSICHNSSACELVPYMYSSSITTSSTYGTILTTASDVIYQPDYMYGVSMYFCTNKEIGTINNISAIVTDAASGNNTPVSSNTLNYLSPISGGQISNEPTWNDSGTGYCYNFRYAFTVNERSSWVGIRIKPDSNVSSIRYRIFGLSHYNYGVDSAMLRGLATTGNLEDMTDAITDNQDQNTEELINNQNENTDKQIESQEVCKETFINKDTSVAISSSRLNSSGDIVSASGYFITDYYKIHSPTQITAISANSNAYYCFYTKNKEVISCKTASASSPDNAVYVRFTALTGGSSNQKKFRGCKNGNEAISDSLNDDDSSGATDDAGNFFSGFTTNTHGLTGIITAPLNAIQSLTSTTCSPLVVPLPFVNQNLTLPCMRSIYTSNFGSFMSIYDIVVIGIVAYWIMVRIFALVKDFKNPEHDEVEVVDL